uniref:Uncharacterized protein n=1 Tax=Romanomermis culicivorax TaxID=13658 RepID=A0A915JKB4_ROMCU
MRVRPNEIEFAAFLQSVGNRANYELCTRVVTIEQDMLAEDLSDLISFCFPGYVTSDLLKFTQDLINAALLAPTNLTVSNLNKLVLKALPRKEQTTNVKMLKG